MPKPYLVSSIPEPELSEFYRLMSEEIENVAVFFMDVDGVITTWNRAAEVIKGYTAEEAIGHHLAMLYTPEDRARHWPEHNLREAMTHGFYQEETWRMRGDGRLFWARIALTALKDHSGRLRGFSKVTVDLTDHKRLEGCVKEREQTRRVLRAANAGMWTWHPDTMEVDVCSNFLRLLGHPGEDTTVSFGEWLSYFHEDDRAKVVGRLHAGGGRDPFDMEFRLRVHGGTYRWFYAHAEWYRELDAGPWQLSGVNVQIERVKQAQADLHMALSRLRETDARKDEFLAMLAHELRNPLAPIRAAAAVMRRSHINDERLRKTSEVISRQCDHLTSLVDDLLDVSRVTRGLVDLQKTRLDLRDIVTDAIEQVVPVIQARHQQLATTHAPQAAIVVGDEKRLVQVVANLLNNAAKYTPPDGHLGLVTEVRNGRVWLSVSDDGIGMEPETAERVFELFAQAERTPDRSSGGLGLGLALVKSLVELHGGDVACSSAGLGKGSVFTVWLPLAVPESQDQRSDPHGFQSRASGEPLRVTVVDDNVDAAEMLALLLQGLGHDVATQPTPRAALEQSLTRHADVFLLDIGLPEMDGYALARRLKAQPETKDAVLIAVTGYGQESDRAEAAKAGFSHHLVKPVDPDQLIGILEGIAAGS